VDADQGLIGRLLRSSVADPMPPTAFEEVLALECHDVSGSKLRVADMFRALVDLTLVAAQLNRRSRAIRRS